MDTSAASDIPPEFGYVAPPLGRADIKQLAGSLHKLWTDLTDQPAEEFDVIFFMDAVLPHIEDGFTLITKPIEEMGDFLGLALPGENVIYLREDIYKDAESGDVDAMKVCAHELGHHLLHGRIMHPKLADKSTDSTCSAEAQADLFAEELVIRQPTQLGLF